MRIQRLPVVPRPYRDELSTSCLGRVACRYGPDANELACYIVNDAQNRMNSTGGIGLSAFKRFRTRWVKSCQQET